MCVYRLFLSLFLAPPFIPSLFLPLSSIASCSHDERDEYTAIRGGIVHVGAFGDALLRTEGAPTLGEMLSAVSKDRKCGASDAGCGGGGSCDAVVYRGVSSEGAVE